MNTTTTAILITIAFSAHLEVKLDLNQLTDQLKKSKPVVPEDSNIHVSDEIKVSDSLTVSVSKVTQVGALSMIKSTDTPSSKELELIKAARGDRPFNSIFGVQVNCDEKGNIRFIQWNEN